MRYFIPALLLAAAPAFAQITPDDLLANWQESSLQLGDELVYERLERKGDSLTLINVTLADGPETPLKWLRLDGLPDGSVDISFSPNLENIITREDSDGFSSITNFSLSGLALNASGNPAAILYRFSADTLTSKTTEITDSVPSRTDLRINAIAGEIRHRPTANESQNLAGFVTFESITINNRLTPLAPAERTFFDWSALDTRLDLDVTIPNDIAKTDAGIPEGLSMAVTLTTGPYDMRFSEKAGSEFTFSQQSGLIMLGTDARQFSYAASTEMANIALQSSDSSIPGFGLGIEAGAFEIKIPLKKSDEAQDFSLATRFTGLLLDEQTWQGLDPAPALSLAPLNFGFALNGTAMINEDLFDDGAMQALAGPAAELRSLKLSGLSLDFDGLGLNGNGALTFNPDRIDPATGQPVPTGRFEFSLTGALGLLDKIGRMGVVDPLVTLGAKGALGMFARPGNMPDSFSTVIEFQEDGSITANGVALE